jgi:hypothetical protein
MPGTSLKSLEGRLYRAALSLFPAAFRREHGPEMASDFDQSRQEADSASALWMLRACIAIDLVRTLAVQWATLALAEALAVVARRASIRLPAGFAHEDELIVLFMAQISVVLIALTILLSLWVGRLTRPRRR